MRYADHISGVRKAVACIKRRLPEAENFQGMLNGPTSVDEAVRPEPPVVTMVYVA
jgi:hypothetical protein